MDRMKHPENCLCADHRLAATRVAAREQGPNLDGFGARIDEQGVIHFDWRCGLAPQLRHLGIGTGVVLRRVKHPSHGPGSMTARITAIGEMGVLGVLTIYNRHGELVEIQREAELHITGSDWTAVERSGP
jgi:hypothetical protein